MSGYLVCLTPKHLVCRRSCRLGFLLLCSGNPVEVSLADHAAVTVEGRSELYRELADVQVAVHYTAFLEVKGILYEYIALYLAPEVDAVAYDVTLDEGALAYYYAAFALDLSFEASVDADVAWREDLTLDNSSCRNPADGIYI